MLKRADQAALMVVWLCIVAGCVWYFVNDRGWQPIDLDEASRVVAKFTVDINTAGPEEFVCLPGIGQKTAQAIIEYREKNGPFQSIDSLVEVPGVSQRIVNAVRDFLSINHQRSVAKDQPKHSRAE